MATISVGNAAIDRASTTSAGNTVIIRDNAITATGVIDTINVYVASNTTGTKVGVFYLVSGTTYMCRSAATLGNITTGLKQFTGLTLRCIIGDFIGYYQGSAGGFDRADTGGTMSVYTGGDACTVGVSQSYTAGSRLISFNGTGLGWQYISKYNGVAASAISKVNGIAMQSISKINGVAV